MHDSSLRRGNLKPSGFPRHCLRDTSLRQPSLAFMLEEVPMEVGG